jgi:hypothetical protein
MRKSVAQAPTAGEQTQQKPCRTSSDIGAELENHTVGRGPTNDRKGLIYSLCTFNVILRLVHFRWPVFLYSAETL